VQYFFLQINILLFIIYIFFKITIQQALKLKLQRIFLLVRFLAGQWKFPCGNV